uniref:Uncharacterized protein n=1 Tax=Aegilops tauschii TaxID=37682 RepID=R7W2J0_AEGTA
MAFRAPTAATAHGHATPAPLPSSWKHSPITCLSSSRLISGGGGGQRARLATAAHALSSATAAAPFPPPNAEYLAAEFSGHGVTFEAVGDSCAVKMAVRNGSAAHLLLPSGLVTSYKPAMWHGAATEVLHTTVGEGPGGRPVIRGGVSMDFRCARDGPSPWSPGGAWSLRAVRGGPTGSISVELVSVEPPGSGDGAEASILPPDYYATAPSSPQPRWVSKGLDMLLSGGGGGQSAPRAAPEPDGEEDDNYKHLTAELCRVYRHAPREFTVIDRGLDMLLSGGGGGQSAPRAAPEPDGEEDDNYKHLTAELCRVYRHAPREFTVIDRGRRNSVCLSRRGFEELYVFSPGSKYEWYGKFAYVCIGPAMLEPVVLPPGATWQGAQCIRNPNL